MPGYCVSKALPSFSPTGKSIAEYSTTLASFFAASISCGVIASDGGASARAAEANAGPSATALAPFKISRLESFGFLMAPTCSLPLSAERPAAFRRQSEPDFGAPGNGGFRRCNNAQHRAVGCFDHVIAVGAEKHLAGHGGLDGIPGCRRGVR